MLRSGGAGGQEYYGMDHMQTERGRCSALIPMQHTYTHKSTHTGLFTGACRAERTYKKNLSEDINVCIRQSFELKSNSQSWPTSGSIIFIHFFQ